MKYNINYYEIGENKALLKYLHCANIAEESCMIYCDWSRGNFIYPNKFPGPKRWKIAEDVEMTTSQICERWENHKIIKKYYLPHRVQCNWRRCARKETGCGIVRIGKEMKDNENVEFSNGGNGGIVGIGFLS